MAQYRADDFAPRAGPGHHYSVAYPEWADKPYGFATFLRAARFDNSLANGTVVSKRARTAGGVSYVSLTVRLSTRTETGMYDLAREKSTGATRARTRGFVIPSQNEWIKAAYYDPSGGGTLSYWKYPTNPGVFGDGTASPRRDRPGSRDGQRDECWDAAPCGLQAVERPGAELVSATGVDHRLPDRQSVRARPDEL